MRNYWALLPAIAVCVLLALVYAVPTLVNPQFTTNVLGLFRRDDDERTPALNPKERRFRRFSAVAVLVAAAALVGFNVVLTRESNGCYEVAKAWGADDSEKIKDPCIDKLFGAFLSNPDGDVLEDNPQPVEAYQVVDGKKPAYLRWIDNRPSYDKADLVVGAKFLCSEVKFKETDDKIVLIDDITEPCPSQPKVNIVTIDLEKPLGDRKVVTIGDKPVKRIDPDMPSWGTVLKKLATGG